MQFTREINRLLAGVLAVFGVMTLSAAYWAVFGSESILLREDNPRRVVAEAALVRGNLLDRDGEPLVTSEPGTGGAVMRRYLYPEFYSALGYASLRYGTGGAEAAYNTILRGDDLPQDLSHRLTSSLLHRPQQGSDIRLTFDLDIQRVLADAMRGQTGAAVILAVPSGEILGMVSLPTYDPNTLDANWDMLTASEGKPFFNRALQGSYQPGGTLQTPLMAAAIVAEQSLDEEYANATGPVTVDDLTLTCAVRLPDMPLNLRDAFAFACPAPFRRLATNMGSATVESTLSTFHLYAPPTLPGFVNEPRPTQTPPLQSVSSSTLVKSALGQGSLTVTPLTMAVMAAALINDGNAPQPYAIIETRSPNSTTWVPVEAVRPTLPVATTNTARQIADLMRYTVANGAAQNAGRPNIDIGGHATLAYGGDRPLTWFVGFATLGGRRGIAAAVVLENSIDPGLAADIGGTALAAAHAALAQP